MKEKVIHKYFMTIETNNEELIEEIFTSEVFQELLNEYGAEVKTDKITQKKLNQYLDDKPESVLKILTITEGGKN
jgi:hypothetical protein